MKKHVFLAKMLMFMAFTGALSWSSLTSAYGQASAYGFSQSNGTYSPITGTSFLVNEDDANSAVQNIGFTFNFAGANFTQFVVNSNGHIRLGTTNTTGQYAPISTPTNTNALSPFGRDGRSLGGVIVATQGSAPNRVCIVQFDDYQVHWNTVGVLIDMQIKLYESTNVIEFVYRDAVANATNWPGQVGIKAAAGDFNNRSTTTNWNSSTQGTDATNTMAFSTAVTMPVNGLTFTWSPPAICSGTPDAGTALNSFPSSCSGQNFTLNATGISQGPGLAYQWQEAASVSGPWSDIVGATTVSYVTSATVETFYRLRTVCTNSSEENFSSVVSVSIVDCFSVPFSGNNTISACAGLITDHGGQSGDYANNANGFTIINPLPGNLVQLSGFTAGENCCDNLRIYDGAGIGGTILWQGIANAGTVPLTTSTTGPLTVEFTSDGSVVGSGFALNIQCLSLPGCTGTPDNGVAAIASSNVCSGVNFTITTSGATLGDGIEYQWQQSPTGAAPWTDIIGATASTLITSETVDMSYRMRTYCANSMEESFTNVVSIFVTECYFVPFSGDNSITTCSGILYDHAGPTGNYANGANGFTVINPTAGNVVQVSGFTAGENCCDNLRIYDGVGIGGTILWQGIANAGAVPLTTSTTGALTVQFTSDGSIVGPGFELNISCIPAPSCLIPSGLSNTNLTSTTADHSWTASLSSPAGYEWAVTTSATPPASGTFTANTSASSTGLIGGTQYYLHVRSDCGVDGFSDWVTSTVFLTPGPGDNCALALPISCGASLSSTTVGRPTDAVAFCGTTNGTGGKVWYEFTGNGDFITASLCGSTFDTKIWVFEGDCNALNCVVGNDDFCGLQSEVQFASTNGSTYYIVVGGFGAAQGAYTLNLTCVTPPAPPTCATNVILTPTPNCDNYDITLEWDPVVDADGYNVYAGTASGFYDIANPFDAGTDTEVFLQNPSLNTEYFFLVVPYNLGGEAIGCVNEVSILTGNIECACIPQYTFGKTAGDLISNVEIPGTTLANNSGTAPVNPAFTYFTGEPNYTADLIQGGSYNVTISIGTWGDQALRAWIDYNDDGVFDDTESIGATTVAPGGGFNAAGFPPAIFNVNLSNSAPLGTHRMRIRTAWLQNAATLSPCDLYAFGETEDYDITIVAPTSTQLRAIDCGATNVTMNQMLRAIQVGAPNYRFRISGANNGGPGWNNDQFIYDTPNGQNHFRFQFIPGSAWGETYTVEVAVGDGFGNYGPYGNSCNVTLENQTTTQITAATCGATVTMGDFVLADWAPGALGYRFRIQGANNGGAGWSGNTFIYETTAPVRSFKFNNHIPGSLFGETYSIDVAVLSGNGNWLPYGTACNVTIATPSTQIQASQCGISNVALPTSILADNVVGASGYRFRITGANSANWMNDQFILNRPNRVMQFQMVAGVLAGEVYQIEVAVMDANGNYGAYGAACNVTVEGAPAIVINDENEIFMADKSLVEVAFGANASHNPFTTEFGIQVLNANDTETINVVIYDMSGKLIERNAVNPMDIEAAQFGANLASGMYMIEVRQGSNQAVIRQVKN